MAECRLLLYNRSIPVFLERAVAAIKTIWRQLKK
jgi:hypothetical protein